MNCKLTSQSLKRRHPALIGAGCRHGSKPTSLLFCRQRRPGIHEGLSRVVSKQALSHASRGYEIDIHTANNWYQFTRASHYSNAGKRRRVREIERHDLFSCESQEPIVGQSEDIGPLSFAHIREVPADRTQALKKDPTVHYSRP